MQHAIHRMFSITSSGLSFIYKSTPWMMQFTNGDSGYMIGSFLIISLRALRPALKMSASALKYPTRVTNSGIGHLKTCWMQGLSILIKRTNTFTTENR
jgi:hypothetical protein